MSVTRIGPWFARYYSLRMRKRISKTLPVLTVSLLLSASSAVLGAAPAARDFYHVEVLVFQANLPYLEGEELWTRDVVNTKLPGVDKAVELPDTPAVDSKLWNAAGTLGADRDYRVLLRKRWLLPADTQGDAKRIYLRGVNAEGWEVEGTLRFYQSRFLHADVELLLREPLPRRAATDDPNAVPKSYRISEHRRIRSGQIDYFDHPKFGALLSVAPAGKK